jgi:hypothetical protein
MEINAVRLMIRISYIVPSEELAHTSKDTAILVNPFVKRHLVLPNKLDFSVSIGILFDNAEMTDLRMAIFDPEKKMMNETDVKALHFDSPDLFEEDGTRVDAAVAAEITLISEEGLEVIKPGMHIIKVISEEKTIAESFFYVTAISGEENG